MDHAARNRGGTPAALLLAACLLQLARHAAALRFVHVGNMPQDASLRDMDIWAASGIGMASTRLPTTAQWVTTNAGRNWTQVLPSWCIERVWMVGNWTVLASGSLTSACDAASGAVVPRLVLKYTRSDGQWRVSLRPPNASLAVGIAAVRMVVLPGAQNAFAVGDLQWKREDGTLTTVGPDGYMQQHVWRYNAALDAWTVIHTVRVLSGPYGWINSLAAASNVACWVGYAGTGRIAFFDGYGWSVTRWGADSDRVISLQAAAPNRCHAVIGSYASQAHRLFLWNGVSWVLKYSSPGRIWSVSAPPASPNFALALERPSASEPAASVLRYRGGVGTWSVWSNFSMAPYPNLKSWADPASHSVRAASSAWAVLANVVPTGSGTTPSAYMLQGRVLWGGEWWWLSQTTGLSSAAQVLYGLCPVPPGAAVVGHAGPAGVRRLG